jgi:hypothetical protein
MGFFKDLRTISKQANEINRNRDVGAQMAQAAAAMDQANRFLVDQTVGARAASDGLSAELQVTSARDTGSVVNAAPVIELDLLVRPDGEVPYPVTVRQVVPLSGLGRIVPGSVLVGQVDPARPTSIWIDWTA